MVLVQEELNVPKSPVASDACLALSCTRSAHRDRRGLRVLEGAHGEDPVMSEGMAKQGLLKKSCVPHGQWHSVHKLPGHSDNFM